MSGVKDIAIIGSGISGLTCAYLLNRQHNIHVFEANDYIGGHTNTVPVKDNNTTQNIDTGFIVFNEKNYPNLTRIFNRLGVASQDSNMSFSVHCEESGLIYNGTSFNRLFSQRRNLLNFNFLTMLKDIVRFNQHAPAVLNKGIDDTVTVHDFVTDHNYSPYFYEKYLIPLGASLWSSPVSQFMAFPVKFVIEFLHNHSMLQVNDRPVWKTVRGGSQQYIPPMTKEFSDRIHLSTPVTAIERQNDGVRVYFAGGQSQNFDEVIIAAHSDQALKMLTAPRAIEREVLGSFKYEPNAVVLHTDTSLLPSIPRAWGSWNYRITRDDERPAAVTYNMNLLQALSTDTTYCVTLNQSHAINPDKVIAKFNYMHPQFFPGRDALQAEQERLIRKDRISCCGAYWGYGFHEDGVNSALAVCSAFGQELH